MKKFCVLFSFLVIISACSMPNLGAEQKIPEPDYERFVKNVIIVSKNTTHITYEYRNVRVDELAIMAALYCHDQGEKRAALDKILLHRNNGRRATFICKNPNFEK